MPTKTKTDQQRQHQRKIHVNPVQHQHVPEEYLENLITYKYSGVDNSILSQLFLNRWWNYFVTLVPKTVAPNMMTLTGFCFCASSALVLLYFFAFENGNYPSWAWYYSSFAVFAYATLDATDGKQARRTKTGSPLGELFDHGCDAFYTPLCQVCAALVLDLTVLQRFSFCMLACSALFFQLWEQYSTGTLELGYINAPVEGLVIAEAIFLLRGWYGVGLLADPFQSGPIQLPSVFRNFLVDTLAFPRQWLEVNSIGECIFAFCFISAMVTVVVNMFHVATKPYIHEGSKRYIWMSTLPTIFLCASCILFYNMFPGLVEKYPFFLELGFGWINSLSATRLTIARLCKMTYRPVFVINVLMFSGLMSLSILKFLATTTISSSIPKIVSSTLLHWCPQLEANVDYLAPKFIVAMCFICAGKYLHTIISLFIQISEFLKINVLTMTEKQLQVVAEMEEEERKKDGGRTPVGTPRGKKNKKE